MALYGFEVVGGLLLALLLLLLLVPQLPAVAGGLLLLFELVPHSSNGVTANLPADTGAVGLAQPIAITDATASAARTRFMVLPPGVIADQRALHRTTPLRRRRAEARI